MATTYTGLRVQDTYNAIIKIGDNSSLSSTAKLLSDGLGNDSPLYLSGTRLGIGISPAYQFHTTGNAKIGGDVIISGDLTVNGDLTYLNVTDLQVEDPLIKLAKDNTSNTLDIGFFGKYVESATTKYTGLFWDASTDKFRLYEGLQVEPTTTVDVTGTGYTRSLLNANLEGNVTGTVSSLSNHDTNDLVEGSVNLYYTNARADARVNLQTGVNLDLSNKDTDDLSEGSTNLYFTTARARASFSAGDGITITNGVIASEGDAEVAKRIDVTVKNVSGGSLAKGVVVHAAPTATPPSGNVIEVVPADANVVASMPAIGVLNETIADEAEGEAVMFGAVSGIDTSSFSIGDELYVSETAGEFTATKPTAFSSEVQKIAIVIKSHASNGLIKVFGAGRANDIPNRVNRDMNFTDGSKLEFGTDSDLEIYHDGTDGYIDNINGELIIQNNSNDKKIIFKSDNGIGDITEYFRIDGNINRNVITVTTQLNDNVPMIFGSGAGSPSIKYDSTATQLFISGDSKFLNDLYVVGATSMSGVLTMNGNTISMGNGAIVNANNLSFNDPGGDEGIAWLNGNLWKIYESPNDLTNAAGNLQFVKDTTRSMTLDTSGNLYILGGANINGETTIKSNDGLVLYTVTSEASLKPKITFSTLPDNPVQFGVIEYTHLDSLSQGGGHSFSFVGEDNANDNLVIMAGDGTKTGTYLSTSRGSTNHADFGFYGDINTGMYRPADHTLGFLANGSRKINISSTTVAIQNATLTAGAINASASITATGNSNSFGNTTIGALSASSGTFSASVTAAGNSNSFGTTTITNLTTTTSFAATNSIIVNSTGTAGLYLRGDSNNSGDTGQLDAVIEMTQDANTHGFELGSYNYSGYSEFAIKQLTDDGAGGFNKSNVLRSSKSNDINIGGLTKDGSTVWRRLGVGVTASMLSRETGSADAIFSNNLYIGSDNVDKRLVAGGAARIFMNDDITRFQYSGTSTADSGISWTESMRIKNNGNIGIGDTDPGFKLSVYHPTSNVVAKFKSGDNTAWISIQDDDSGTYGVLLGVSSDSNQDFIVADASANKKLILSDGKFGIQATNPLYHFSAETSTTGLISRIYNTNADGQGLLIRAGATSSATRIFQAASTNDTKVMTVTSNGRVGIGSSATDPTQSLTIDQSGGSIDLRGGNNRIYFTGQRALEGNAAGTVLQIGESYSETFMYGQVGINCNPAERLHVLGKVRFDGYSLTDPDTTSTANYPADVMLTHYTAANGVSIIGGQGGYTGCGLTIGEETGRSGSFKFIRGISDTNGSPTEEFWINGIGTAYFAGTVTIGGNLVVDNMLTINIDDISTGENRGLKLYNENSTGQQWNLTTGITGVENTSFCIRDATANVNAFTMAKISGNATFSGTVEATNVGVNGFITHNGDSGTFMGWSANDTNVFYTAGNERLRINADGNLGIGGEVNPSYKLDITGSGMRIKDTGDVQIIVNADTDNADETHSPVMRFLQDGTHNMLNVGSNGSSGTPDFTGLLDNAAYVMGGTGHSGTVPLQFGTGGISFMIIKKSGSLPLVGINTTDPAATLEVNTNGGFEGSLRLDGTGNTSRGILIRNVGTAEGGIKTDGNFTINIEDANRTMRFKTANTERMSISSGGIINVPSGARIDMGPGTWKNGSYPGNPIGTLNVEKAAGNPIQMFNTQEGFQFLAFVDSQSSGAQISTIGWSSGSGNPFKITNMGNTAIYITSAGYVGIKKTSGISYALDVTGSIRATSDVIAFSDRRVKENIVTIDNALEKVTKLRGVKYTRKDINDKSTKVGVIAQEVLEVLPEVVEKDDQGMYSVAYGNMAGVFIEAIKELKAEVDSLKREIKQLKK